MKKRKFGAGGSTENMTPEDVAERKKLLAAGRAYDKAMPEPDTTFGKIRSGIKSRQEPGRYDSVRPARFEGVVRGMKDAAIGEGVRGALDMGKPAIMASIPGLGAAAGASDAATAADKIRGAVRKYKNASEMEDSAERELSAQDRREARGMKTGGSVSASRRADGIAQRGKTRGKMC